MQTSKLLLLVSAILLAPPSTRVDAQPPGTQAHSAQAAEARAAEAVVRAYVSAWSAGDLPAMYRMWDAHSRRSVTLQQLEAAFTRHPKALFERPGAAGEAVVLGRPLAFVSSHATVETNDYASVDCVARYTFQSMTGYPFAALIPGLFRDAKKERGDGMLLLAIAMAGDNLDKPKVLNTAQGGFRTPTSGQGALDELPPPTETAAIGDKPPFITLYLHRYVLTREGHDWKIANAVTVSDLP